MDETFRNGKRYEDKAHCLLSSYKVWRNFFRKKALHGGTNLFGQIYRWMFYMGTNDQIVQGESLWLLRRFKDQVKLVFLSLTLTRVVHILFEKLTPQIGD